MKNLITCLVVSVMSGATFADTWTVDDDGKADFDNIQAAVDASSDGDEIIVMPGTYTNSTGSPIVNIDYKSVTLRSSSGPANTFIDGQNFCSAIRLFSNSTSGTTIEGFTIRNCYGYSGSGVNSYQTNTTVNNCIFTNNESSYGGACHMSYSAQFTNCIFMNNVARNVVAFSWGGAIYASNQVSISNCHFVGNIAKDGGISSEGGAVFGDAGCNISINMCTFESNSAETYGGALRFFGGKVNINGSAFQSNQSGQSGGAISMGAQAGLTVAGTLFCNNAPDDIDEQYTDGGGNTFAESCDGEDDGACCINTSCSIMTSSDCSASGGTYLGDNTNCNGDPCYIGSAMQWTVNGHWYQGVVSKTNLSWEDAQAMADAVGGHLSTHSTSEENAWIKTNIASDLSLWSSNPSYYEGPWIGGYKNSDGWAWVDGSDWSFEDWHPGNPDSVGDAVIGLWDYGSGRRWQDHDLDGTHTSKGLIVEWDADCNNDGIVDYGQILDGTLVDSDGNGIPDECDCPDINSDGYVNVSDLLTVIDQWGLTNSPADVNQDGIVDVSDMLIVIGNWGECE